MELADRLGLHSKRHADFGELLVYPVLREGRVIRHKYRALVPQEGKPRFFAARGGIQAAFNEDCLRDDSLLNLPLVVTEGYEDCMAVLMSGHPRCISVPDGAPEKPVEDIEDSKKYEWLDAVWPLIKHGRVKEIILAVDGDPAGAALQHDLCVKLGKARCKFITYPKTSDETRRLKDMNEVLCEHGLVGVRTTLARAQMIKVEGVYTLSELPPMPESMIYDIGFEALGEHLKLRLGDMSIWTGIGGYGKTTLLNDMLCRIALRYGVRVAWASFEQDPQRDHRRAFRSWFHEDYEFNLTDLQKAEADGWIDRHHRFLIPNDEEDATVEWLIQKMEAAVLQHDCKFIVIDPFNEIEDSPDPHESEVRYINRVVRTFRRFAKHFQIHLCVVAHPTKMPRLEDGTYMMPGLLDVSGGAVWRNKAVQGIIVHLRGAEETIVKVDKVKYREILGSPGMVQLAFNKQTRRYVETDRNVVVEEKFRKRRA